MFRPLSGHPQAVKIQKFKITLATSIMEGGRSISGLNPRYYNVQREEISVWPSIPQAAIVILVVCVLMI